MIFSICLSTSYAIEFEDAVFPELATSSRALAMGNAFIAKTDDAAAAWYNPAGLGTVRGTRFHLSNFQLESNKGWMSAATGGEFFDVFGNFSKAFSIDGLRELLSENRGKIAHSRFHMLPNFTSRYFTLGYLYSVKTRATIGQETGAQFEYANRRDHGPYIGLNLSLFGGIFKIGASAVYLQRREAIGESDPDTTIDLQDNDYSKGNAVIITSGMRLTFPWAGLPTFALTSHNSAQQDWSSIRGAGAPTEIKNTIDVGFSITPQVSNSTRIHFELNYKDATKHYEDVSNTRRLLAGMEIDVGRTFFFRLGYGDGFGSGGIGIRTKKVTMDLTTYAVDTTSNEFRGEEDRRFVLGFSTGL